MDDTLIRYLHFLGIIVFSSGLAVELFLLSKEVTSAQMRKIATADAMCGVSFILVIVTGLLLWFVVGKPSEFYSENNVFYLKMSVLFGIIVLAISPAIFFSRNRNSALSVISIPQRIIFQVRAEVVLLVFMPLLAVLMAKGYGLS